MEGFSDIESSSAEVGSEVSEVESKDSDFGDGDGVNDFNETYNEMNSGNETMEYSEGQEFAESSDSSDNNDFETTDAVVESGLDDFDDSDSVSDAAETQTANNNELNESNVSEMTTDESVDEVLSDFDDSNEMNDVSEESESSVENETEETIGETESETSVENDATENQEESYKTADNQDTDRAEDVNEAEEATGETDSTDDVETSDGGETPESVEESDNEVETNEGKPEDTAEGETDSTDDVETSDGGETPESVEEESDNEVETNEGKPEDTAEGETDSTDNVETSDGGETPESVEEESDNEVETNEGKPEDTAEGETDSTDDVETSDGGETPESVEEESDNEVETNEGKPEDTAEGETDSTDDVEISDGGETPESVEEESDNEVETNEGKPEDTAEGETDSTDDVSLRNPEQADGVRDITSAYYSQAKEVAQQSPDNGRYYTDHKEDHVEMVAEKSLETGDAIQNAIANGGLQGENSAERVAFSANIDQTTLEGAALSHDTGMCGDGYALEKKGEDGTYGVHREDNSNFNEVRSNHSLNSAINVLENRDEYKAIGYSDDQVDKIAAECMAHSKSSSGVRDLNSKADWADCFDRIDATVDAYNKDHPDAPISFDRTIFENDDEKLGLLASETLALRVGDVSRDSFTGAEAQAGENVYVDRATINNHGGSVEKELENAKISIGENGEMIEPDNLKSRQVHTGEQNIVENHTYANGEGSIVHEITVDDGASASACTQEAIVDHLGELATAKDGSFEVDIKFNSPCDEYAQEKYNQFRREIKAEEKYSNVEINYPWDRRK